MPKHSQVLLTLLLTSCGAAEGSLREGTGGASAVVTLGTGGGLTVASTGGAASLGTGGSNAVLAATGGSATLGTGGSAPTATGGSTSGSTACWSIRGEMYAMDQCISQLKDKQFCFAGYPHEGDVEIVAVKSDPGSTPVFNTSVLCTCTCLGGTCNWMPTCDSTVTSWIF